MIFSGFKNDANYWLELKFQEQGRESRNLKLVGFLLSDSVIK